MVRNTSVRHQAIARTLWIVLWLNLLVAATKLSVGVSISALALVADGLHSALDASSNVVGLVGISVAAQPPDSKHPYGHHRFETLAALLIGLLIGSSFIGILREALVSVLEGGARPAVSWPAAAAVAGTVVVNLVISRYERQRALALRSAILEADSRHTLSDAAAAGAVLVGFAGVALGYRWADPLAAFVVAIFIGRTAWSILKTNFSVLADEVRLEPQEVYDIVLNVPGVLGAHQIRSRGASDAVHLDLHIHLDPHLPLTDAHAKTHEVSEALKQTFPELHDVLIHTEPADGRERDMSRLAPGEDDGTDSPRGSESTRGP